MCIYTGVQQPELARLPGVNESLSSGEIWGTRRCCRSVALGCFCNVRRDRRLLRQLFFLLLAVAFFFFFFFSALALARESFCLATGCEKTAASSVPRS